MRRQKTGWILWAAISAVPLLALPAISLGQTANQANTQPQQPNYGHANDANNGVGSGGSNGGSGGASSPYNNYTGNQVVNGQVTNGRAFQGNAPSSDLRAFQGSTPLGETTISNFTRDSTGVPVYGQGSIVPNQATPYYSESRAVAPPAGYGRTQPGQYGYIPVVPTTPDVDAAYHLGSSGDSLSPFMPKVNELLLPAGVDASGNQTLVAGSSLYGVRALKLSDTSDQAFLAGLLQQGITPTGVDAATVDRIRDEINKSAAQPGANTEVNNSEAGNTTGNTNTQGNTQNSSGGNGNTQSGLSQPLARPAESPSNLPITDSIVNAPLQTSINNSVQAQPLKLAAPEQQSSQYQDLQNRLKLFNTAHQLTSSKNSAASGKGPNAPAIPATNPGVPPTGTPNTVTPSPTGTEPEPLEVKSLATGMHAKGMSDFLVNAEALMKQGKYSSAIDQYETAEEIAPNNPLITIGRANAELGAGLFGQADHHLREALGKDQSLLMARYDLRGFIGEQRLGEIVAQLKKISETDQSPQPVFLLAYIAYNTDNARRAEAFLTLAEQRSGGKDPLYQVIRDHWKLPTTEPTDQP